ncbi:helix-turn-helix domain-containing protein [bacterium 1XD42-8]|jgi:transcriptional regulator with XRE-family HTH domain|nr:helix-turn-helix transcriptional regulator [Lachnospiraceae bacterium]RKJ49318.1 helix-turn-helix domain-containing protein [bacterium 1XD42-8]
MGIKYEEVLQRIKEERNSFGWSQDTISQKLRMTQSHYSKTESGKKRFSYQELRLLNDIGIDLDYVFTGQRAVKKQEYDLLVNCGSYLQNIVEVLYIVAQPFCKNLPVGKRIGYMKYILAESGSTKSIWRLIREYSGYTQREMAVLLGIDIKKYRRLEKKEVQPDSEIILALYNQFHISPLMLLGNCAGLSKEVCEILDSLEEKTRGEMLRFLQYVYHLLRKQEDRE